MANPSVRFVLDEMHAPVVAHSLREAGHDVIAVADTPELRAMTDEDLFQWAAEHSRRIVTENIKDFRRILSHAEESGWREAEILFTSSRTFSRSRRNPRLLIAALDAWLRHPDAANRPSEDWLKPA